MSPRFSTILLIFAGDECMHYFMLKAWISSKLDQIRQWTAELATLERLENM